MRDAIAFALDGAVPEDDNSTNAAYSAAAALVSEPMRQPMQRLRRLAAAGFVSATSRFDDAHRFLRSFDAVPVSTCSLRIGHGWPGIVFVGCLGTADPEHDEWVRQILSRGGIVVSSDMSAALPSIGRTLVCESPQPARIARVELSSTLSTVPDVERFLDGFYPGVRLSPGHRPLRVEQSMASRVVARDVQTGEPLVVHAQAGDGQIIHSVGHWWQERAADLTTVGSRPLSSVPAFAAFGAQYPDARFGAFTTALVMGVTMLDGINAALDGVDRHLRADSTMSSHDAD